MQNEYTKKYFHKKYSKINQFKIQNHGNRMRLLDLNLQPISCATYQSKQENHNGATGQLTNNKFYRRYKNEI